ncbi:MAG: hypothetical protein M3R67_13425, partial [Acidobacteriota bacterium]|nr:hypothetical protein [Acidobacteriota bacterium]
MQTFFPLLLISLFVAFPFHTSYSDQTLSMQAPVTANLDADSQLLEIGRASRIRSVNPSPISMKVVSYNIRWLSGEDLHKLAQLFKDDAEIGGASILGLQEVDRNKQRTGNTNTAKA